MAHSFKDLVAWQKSMQLAVQVYELTKEFPREELYGLTSQMRRCSVSIPSNIAEGQGRANPAEFRQFLSIARGSNCELQTQLILARTVGLGSKKLIEGAEQLSDEIRKMLFRLLQSLNGEPSTARSMKPNGNRELRTMN